jgi:hypothetical protein
MEVQGNLKDIQTKQEELLKKRKELLKTLHQIEEEASKAGYIENTFNNK